MSKNLESAIVVKNLSKSFRVPLDKSSGIKQLVINFYKRRKGYREFKALDGISFEIKKGEFFGIVGRNGSGKSTLLKLLAGTYVPNSGGVQVNGSLIPFIELGVGFNPELTGRENVFLNGALLGFSKSEMEDMYDEIVDFAELQEFMEERLKNYSSGMQVRLAFSIAIRAQGDILVLDEVLAVGDEAFQQKCYNYFEELKNNNQTIVLVSHSMDAIKRFCSKAILLKDGKICEKGNVYEVADAYLLENIEQIKKNEHESNKNLKFSIKEETKQLVKVKADYKSKNKCFVSLSLWRDGIYMGGITTDEDKPLKASGSLEFTIDKSILNPGTYAVGGGLFKISNQSQLAIVKASDRKVFLIEGKEKRRGGAIKLKDTWVYGS